MTGDELAWAAAKSIFWKVVLPVLVLGITVGFVLGNLRCAQ